MLYIILINIKHFLSKKQEEPLASDLKRLHYIKR